MSIFKKPEILLPKIVKKRRSLHNAVVQKFRKITWLQPLFGVFGRLREIFLHFSNGMEKKNAL
jgi:hypothetical protein